MPMTFKILAIVALYFLIGGVVGSVILYVIERNWKEQPVDAVIVSILWPVFLILAVISVGNAIGEGIIKAIRKSREKHSL